MAIQIVVLGNWDKAGPNSGQGLGNPEGPSVLGTNFHSIFHFTRTAAEGQIKKKYL